MQQIDRGTRIGTMILDHIIMSFIMVIVALPFMLPSIISDFDVSHGPSEPLDFNQYIYLFLIGFSLYFCKDIVNGRSIAKRALKLQVVNNKTGVAASPYRCLVRNLFIILWPIEAIVAIINPSRRIGDLVAGTKVIVFDKTVEQPKVQMLPLVICLLMGYLFIFPLGYFTSKIDIKQPIADYSETSYNQETSDSLQVYLFKTLGEFSTPDVRVYDTLTSIKGTKYVSLILHLKENYLGNDESTSELNSIVYSSIYTFMNPTPFDVKLQYIYQSATQKKIYTTTISSATTGDIGYIYAESMLNTKLTEEIMELYDDSLSLYIVPRISIYNVTQSENEKLASQSIWVTPQGFEKYNNLDGLHQGLTNLLRAKYPDYHFLGEIQYQYQESGENISKSYKLDTK